MSGVGVMFGCVTGSHNVVVMETPWDWSLNAPLASLQCENCFVGIVEGHNTQGNTRCGLRMG
eukprot:m.130500 g.130500  ORF g.130500 m.130500 type:complete len:62 (+) comp13714_c0_seq1:2662-2847(+)